jgi:uncharacterized protein YcbK (DUF882 family)
MAISPWFDRSEFACKCECGFNTVDAELLEILDMIRSHYNARVTINSACRCPEHNKSVGGAENSQHLFARAADIVVDGVDPKDVQDYIDTKWPNQYGMGRYNTFTHIDSRSTKARW